MTQEELHAAYCQSYIRDPKGERRRCPICGKYQLTDWVEDGTVKLRCSGGCQTVSILAAWGLTQADLHTNGKPRAAEMDEVQPEGSPFVADDDYVPERQREMQRQLEKNPEIAAEVLTDWTKPEKLGDDLLPVPELDIAMLPEAFRSHVSDVSDRMQVPIDLPAVCAVSCLAGVVNRRASIQPKRADDGWIVTPNLWGAIVAPPGEMKTPILGAFTDPLSRIEGRWRETYESELEDYQEWQQKQELKHRAWQQQYILATKKGADTPLRPEASRNEPTLRRLIANDPTFEALHSVLAGNPAGILLVRDELAGWLATLDKPGREGERQFFLESWNGDKPYTVDRIGRGTIFVPGLCLSIVGGIQPGRLRQYLADAVKDGPGNDGLFQRLQLIVWPDIPKDWKLVDRPSDRESVERVAKAYERLAALPADNPPCIKFADDAQELFYTWWPELERKIRCGSEHPALTAHLAKYRSLMPSLALLFQLADSRETTTVSLDHAAQAAEWCEYLEQHARRIYGCLISPELHAARQLAQKISSGQLAGEFSTRDIYLKGWSGLATPDEARAALRVLEDAGWVRQVEAKKHEGRPPERWKANPRAREEYK